MTEEYVKKGFLSSIVVAAIFGAMTGLVFVTPFTNDPNSVLFVVGMVIGAIIPAVSLAIIGVKTGILAKANKEK